MLVAEFLEFLLDDALEDARERASRLRDALAFAAVERALAECRAALVGDLRQGLADLLLQAREDARAALVADQPDRWFWFVREAQVEWIAEVVSVLLLQHGLPTVVPPGRGAALEAARLVGALPRDDSVRARGGILLVETV